MAWLTPTEFREIYVTRSATAQVDAQVNECLDEALDDTTALVGDARAAAVVAYDAIDSPTAEQTRLYKALRRAQGKLAYRALLLIQSSRSRDGGIMESERDTNGDTINKYVPFADIKRRAALYSGALEAINLYVDSEISSDNYADAPAFQPSSTVIQTICDDRYFNRFGLLKMDIDFSIEIDPAIPQLSGEIEGDVSIFEEKLISKTTRYLPQEIRFVLNESEPSGRLYARAGGESFQRFHQASAKGQPPGKDTGDLEKSLQSRTVSANTGELSVIDYAEYLDPLFDGHLNRPFIEKGFERALTRALGEL